ncbi:C40 family peptidase [Modestobacter sp. Leaf380]|uniref:C40 family peptidase n=1 Tax=Modestobacter sp. Leaf380 TaxID=1736356 RepID=UPI000B303679|nr:C40 family peptidase [Modestobacter sp. Leaf380]
MASPSPALGRDRSTPSRHLGRGLLIGAAASLVLTALPGTATAAPDAAPTGATQATTPEQATELVTEANHQLEVVTEQVNEARVQLADQQAAAATADQAVADAATQLASLSAQMDQVARSAYTTNPSSFSALMTSSSPEDFLAQVSTLDVIAGHTNDLVDRVAQAAQTAADAQSAADTAAATAQQGLDAVTAQQTQLQEKIATYQAQYEALTASQQQQVVTAHSGAEVTAPTTVAADSELAQAIVDTAMAQRGDSYVWGAGGPDSFDCSGLTAYAYAAAGVSLPHSSASQARMGNAVSRGDLQPGDLVYFYSPVSHIGIYIGNGMMVHAPTSGDVVKVSSVDMSGYAGARRLV